MHLMYVILLPESASPWWYCQHIGDMSVQAQCLLEHLPQWPGCGCQDALKAVLGHHHQTLSPGLKLQLQETLQKISIYEKVIFFFSDFMLIFTKAN